MSRYTSEQTAYSSLKKKYVPLWRLDTNTMTVTHFNTDTQTEESKTYHTDFIRYHLHFSDSHCPVRWSFGNRLIVAIRKLSSAVMLRKCSVWRTASSIWREKLCLSVWFIFDRLRLCLRVQPFLCWQIDKQIRYMTSKTVGNFFAQINRNIILSTFYASITCPAYSTYFSKLTLGITTTFTHFSYLIS